MKLSFLDTCTYLSCVWTISMSFFGFLTQYAAGIMTLITIFTFLTNFIFQYRKDLREMKLIEIEKKDQQ